MEHAKIIKMGYAIQKLLEEKQLVNAKPKDLMPNLIQKGFFNNDHRNGLPLRNILRDLDDCDMLYLLPQVMVERKETNRFWFFNTIEF